MATFSTALGLDDFPEGADARATSLAVWGCETVVVHSLSEAEELLEGRGLDWVVFEPSILRPSLHPIAR